MAKTNNKLCLIRYSSSRHPSIFEIGSPNPIVSNYCDIEIQFLCICGASHIVKIDRCLIGNFPKRLRCSVCSNSQTVKSLFKEMKGSDFNFEQ